MHLYLVPRLATVPEGEEESDILTLPAPGEPGTSGGDYRVVLYDDDWHDPRDVQDQLVKATGCSPQKAWKIINEVEAKGRSVCFNGDRSKCHEVARVLREIRLQCEVDCD